MRASRNKAVYRRLVAYINTGNIAALDDLFASDVVDHNPVPGQPPGLEGVKQWVRAARATFPDLHASVEDLVAEGDRVAARVTWRGTQLGYFAGVAPSGRPVTFASMQMARFRNGRVVEWWGVADLLGVMEQLDTG